MNLSNFVAYVKQAWKNKPDTSTPLSAERLTHQEEGIKGNSDAIQELAAAVVSQIVNNPDKIASMAALYAVNQKVTTLDGKVGDTAQLPSGTADVASAIAQLYSNFAGIENKISNDKEYVNSLYQRIGDFKNRTSSSLINDISFMIQTKGIHTGGFGFANVEYADRPSNASLWGYIEFFHHADGYVTVKYYPDNMPKIYTGQFIIGQSTWAVPWY